MKTLERRSTETPAPGSRGTWPARSQAPCSGSSTKRLWRSSWCAAARSRAPST